MRCSTELVQRQRRDDDARRDGVDAGASPAPSDRLGHHALDVAALGQLVGVQRVADVAGLQNLQRKQLFGRCRGQQPVGLFAESRQAVSRLAGNGHADPSAANDPSDLLQQHRRAVEVDPEDRFHGGLTRGDPSRIDQHRDLAAAPGRVDQREDRIPRGEIHPDRDGIESGPVHRLGNRCGVLRALVADDDLHAGAHAPGDCHADLSGTGQDHDVFHILNISTVSTTPAPASGPSPARSAPRLPARPARSAPKRPDRPPAAGSPYRKGRSLRACRRE